MARRTGAKCRRCRRVGQQLFLKGIMCLGKDQSCIGKPPGQHGAGRRGMPSRYSEQLCEKQKAKYFYGVLERQFLIYFKKASTMKGLTGSNLLSLLERRLDNVIYRMGFAYSRDHARQLVNHKYFLVNGKRVDVASYLLKEGDVISVRAKESKRKRVINFLEKTDKIKLPEWVTIDRGNLTGSFMRFPSREEIDLKVDDQAIVELYSR